MQHISGLVQVISKIKLLTTSRYFLGSGGFESIQSIFYSGEVDLGLNMFLKGYPLEAKTAPKN